MIIFYSPDITESLTLTESDSGHAVRVLRMREGDDLAVVDGRGNWYDCRLAVADRKRARVEIVNSRRVEPVWHNRITVIVAPTKHIDRMEWLVEKLVEIGVNDIVLVRTAHSERKEANTERLRKIAVSAMKQSLKATLPDIPDMMPLAEAIAQYPAPQRFVGYCVDDVERRLLAREYRPGVDTVVLIGPEGDFTPDEINRVMQAGFVPVTMGDNRLRTETAALVACDTCHIVNQLNEK